MMASSSAAEGWGHRPTPWLTSFEIGDHRIDDEHRNLLAGCNDLCALAARGLSAAEARAAACQLLAAIDAHFTNEEALFPHIHFPHHLGHIHEHRTIREVVGALLLGGSEDFRVATATTRVLMVEHLVRHDLGFKTFVEEAGGH